MERGEMRPLIADVPVELVDAMLDTLPLDITLLDSEDAVRYFSKETKERLFPRTRAIIGRKVQQCHPEKSVHLVNRILDDFKSGKGDRTEFWIDVQDRKIYIRYFAVRDSAGKYLGCVGLDQDITDIQKLEGEKRLLEP
jgi:PAS domain S-box-containing protein